VFRTSFGRMWTGLIWLRIQTSSGLFLITRCSFRCRKMRNISLLVDKRFFYHYAAAPSGPGPAHFRGFMITLLDTTHSVVVSTTHRRLPDNTQHSRETNIHDPGGIQTHNPSQRTAAHPRPRTRGHWDRQLISE
jgi:hypothetical protein